VTLARACLGRCGRLVRDASRCRDCQARRERAKSARRPDRKRYDETKRRREAVADHRARVGDWCPGYSERPGRPAHPSADLTADHEAMVGLGHPEGGPLVVRCRSCNSARAAAIMARAGGSPHEGTATPPRPPNLATHTTEGGR
jgi:hypothetical protein